MKKYARKILLPIAATCVALAAFASTVNWLLWTSDLKYCIDLKRTIWMAETDNQKIIFENRDGDGHFSNGISFSYYPPRYHYNGYTTTPDQTAKMDLYVDGRKINDLRLVIIGGQYILKDRRNIKYFFIERGRVPRKKFLGVF